MTQHEKSKLDHRYLLVWGIITLVPGWALVLAAIPFGIAYAAIRAGFGYGASVMEELDRRALEDKK